jgi:hypothetical protein
MTLMSFTTRLSRDCSAAVNVTTDKIAGFLISTLRPNRQTLHTRAASMLKPDGTSLELDVTEKGRVLVPGNGGEGSEIVFRSKKEGIRLAEVMPLKEVVRKEANETGAAQEYCN